VYLLRGHSSGGHHSFGRLTTTTWNTHPLLARHLHRLGGRRSIRHLTTTTMTSPHPVPARARLRHRLGGHPSCVRQRQRGARSPPTRARRRRRSGGRCSIRRSTTPTALTARHRHNSGGRYFGRSTTTTWSLPPVRARRRHCSDGYPIVRSTATTRGSLDPYSSTPPTPLGWTPLHRAFDSDDVGLARPLLEHATNTTRVDTAPSGIRQRRQRRATCPLLKHATHHPRISLTNAVCLRLERPADVAFAVPSASFGTNISPSSSG
jgi:hypothetical protein